MRGFSWKRAIGISSLKAKIARTTGIPTTKSGRARKWGFWPILARATRAEAGDEPSSGGGCGGCLGLLLVMGGCGYALTLLPTPTPRERPVVTPTAPAETLREIATPPPSPIILAPAPLVEADSEPTPAPPAAPLSYKQEQPEAYGRSQLSLARQYLKLNRIDKAREILTAVVKDLPGTEAAMAAQKEIDKLPSR